MEAGIENLRSDDLRAEHRGPRHVMLPALDRFTDALLQQPGPIRREWARVLGAAVSDRGPRGAGSIPSLPEGAYRPSGKAFGRVNQGGLAGLRRSCCSPQRGLLTT
jgi:hypothetical protein